MNLLARVSFGQPYISMQFMAWVWSRCLIALAAILCLVATPTLAITFSDNGDGTVTAPSTGLTWMRCSMGQTWTGATCSGTASTYTWAQANALTGTVTFAGKSDWRLPNIRELQTIVDRSSYGPAINTITFPNTSSVSYFWSASAFAGPYALSTGPKMAWYLELNDGDASIGSTGYAYQVRMVRGGQSSGLLDTARPTTDYIDRGDGTVTHIATGLMWKRCAEGQAWTGATCSGTATSMTWAAAMAATNTFAGNSDWRLPTADELLSLVDYTELQPAVNTEIFPGMIANRSSWSSSVYVGVPNVAWGVDFGDGDGSGYYTVDPATGLESTTDHIRLVRGSTNLVQGWNLVGNGTDATLDVGSLFADDSRFITVWKWIAAQSAWAFHSPTLAAQGGTVLSDYVSSKGYQLLTTIASGEGFWVNTKQAANVAVPSGKPIGIAELRQALVSGWNLGALGETATPKQFCDAQLNGVTTLWAWDAMQGKWYFYAPSLDIDGGLGPYASGKGYLDFIAANKTLGPGTGFWVNKPAKPTAKNRTGVLQAGDYWEFEWISTNRSSGSCAGNKTTELSGVFGVTLGAPQSLGGRTAFPVTVGGDIPPEIGKPVWKYLAADGPVLLGTLDGTLYNTILGSESGGWKGIGFFKFVQPDLAQVAFLGTFAGEYITTSAWVATRSTSTGGCKYYPEISGDICTNDPSSYSQSEFLKAGIGPIGYRSISSYSYSNADCFGTINVEYVIDLVWSSKVADDGTDFNGAP